MTSHYQPLVSIIVPVYNLEKYIGDCLDSILNQTYQNWEAIVVDDGSTDQSLRICLEYAERDSRFRVITTENGGSSHARNLGLDAVHGEYVMFVDGDDLVTNDAIKFSVNHISEKKVDILASSCVRISEDGTKQFGNSTQTVVDRITSEQAVLLLHMGKFIGGPVTKLFKVDLLRKIRFKQKLTIGEDVYFNTEVLLSNPSATIAITDEVTYKYRVRSSSASHINPDSKLRPYVEKMINLILKFERSMNMDTCAAIANNLYGTILSAIIRRPICQRIPVEWEYECLEFLGKKVTLNQFRLLRKTVPIKSSLLSWLSINLYSINRFINNVAQRIGAHLIVDEKKY